MEAGKSLLYEVEAYVTNFISEQVPKEYAYHDIQHTLNVVATVQLLGKELGLSKSELEILQLAAWFHDTGYDKGSMSHEERSCRYARQYLLKYNYPENKMGQVEACIMATKMPHQPDSLLQQIMCDADLSHLGKKMYWERCQLVRQELALTKNLVMKEEDWLDFELKFLKSQQYHTDAGNHLFGERKAKHMRQLKKQQRNLFEPEIVTVDDIFKQREKLKKKKRKAQKRQRKAAKELAKANRLPAAFDLPLLFDIYKNQTQMSSQADQKANFMLGVNAIVVLLTFAFLLPRFGSTPLLTLPTLILLAACLASISFATLANRSGFGPQTIRKFESLPSGASADAQPHFQEDMLDELNAQADGLLLKYRYVQWCYSSFQYGMILAASAFALAFLFF